MDIVFTREAKRDLDELRAWLEPLSPSGLGNVVATLEQKILSVAAHPGSGRSSPREGVREAIEPRYGFLIPYYVKEDVLFVLRVYRSSRKPLDYRSVDLP